MPKAFTLDPSLRLEELASYHRDVLNSLRLYFSTSAPTFTTRFAGKRPDEVEYELASRIEECDRRSVFFVLSSLEASFRIDFDFRCKRRLKDDLSIYFREVRKRRKEAVRLDDDILEGWKRYTSASPIIISQLRGAFKFRHWLAHGRYWIPKLGRKYDFHYIHLMADSVISGFPFTG